MKESVPAISAVVPVYNVEKYVGACLESILYQSFQDFEVIVVDDCATDRSPRICEEMRPAFGGRMKIVRHRTNSGGVGTPRNTGLRMARGKYVTFIDSDDMLIRSAFQDLYTTAEEMRADVVHTDLYFATETEDAAIGNGTRLRVESYANPPAIKEPALVPYDLEQRAKSYINHQFLWNGWGKLFRRECLLEKGLRFEDIPSLEDIIFTFHCLCRLERYVRFPDAVYIYRSTPGSMTHRFFTADYLTKFYEILTVGFRSLDTLMEDMESFRNNHALRYAVLDFFAYNVFWYTKETYAEHSLTELDTTLRSYIRQRSGDDAALLAYLFHAVNRLWKNDKAPPFAVPQSS